ncbi:MAG: bacteriophage abortive infection AbiH family protein [Bacteroidales bacterium]|nr:bacteriophage abortive infection AbiH family protein [Clostridium sp.]MCM1204304.1 bacteriophage abortive infection AbiH family protein [Bacteroidales bacterium]
MNQIEMVMAANDELGELSLHYPQMELFKNGDAIVTFNYTSTIESLFSISESVPIFHIHGYCEQEEPLIFGYRSNENSYTDNWASLDEENWDYYIEQQRKAVYTFYEAWKKELQMDKLKKFLNKCYGIDRVVVLGHSMSAVDFEYMELIEKRFCPIDWVISYYNKRDIERIQSQNYSFQNKIRFAKMEELLKK